MLYIELHLEIIQSLQQAQNVSQAVDSSQLDLEEKFFDKTALLFPCRNQNTNLASGNVKDYLPIVP